MGCAGTSNRAQPVEKPIKLTAQPVIVLQPDSTIAYTFRDLDETEGDKDAGHLKSQDPATAPAAAAGPAAAAAEDAGSADPVAAVQHSTAAEAPPADSSAAGEGAAAAAPGSPGAAAGEGGAAAARTTSGRARGSLQPQAPLFALGADAERAAPPHTPLRNTSDGATVDMTDMQAGVWHALQSCDGGSTSFKILQRACVLPRARGCHTL